MRALDQDSAPFSNASAFATTHWSLVLRAGNQHSSESIVALEKLCRTYWYPLYAFVRRQGHGSHDAQDLTQEFFSRLLNSDSLDSVHPDKGRFRSFLIASLKHFLTNEWKHSQRQKRGGGQTPFSLDEQTAEGLYKHEPQDHFTPEKAFERRWTETLLQTVLDRLRKEWEADGPNFRFEDLKPFLLQNDGTMPFAEAATRLGATEASLKWAVHKLRKRYRELFREEIAHTVESPDQIQDEVRHLFSVMAE